MLMKEIEEEPSRQAKKRKAKETGYTGLTLLARLNDLYGFDPTKDLVHDVMHLVALNLCKKLFCRYFKDDNFDLLVLQEKLDTFPFTAGESFLVSLNFRGTVIPYQIIYMLLHVNNKGNKDSI